MLQAPAGKVAINSVLPREFRDYTKSFNKKHVEETLSNIALTYPEKYKAIIDNFVSLGRLGASFSGAYPFSLSDLVPPPLKKQYEKDVEYLFRRNIGNKTMNMQDESIGAELEKLNTEYYKKIVEELKKRNNPAYEVIEAGISGNPVALRRLLFAEGGYTDNYNRLIPYPIIRNFAEGLKPYEYWSAAYGSKRGIVSTKLAPGLAGDFYKQLVQATHRLIVTAKDGSDIGDKRGLPVDVDDPDNVGAILAIPIGGYSAGTVLTREILENLKNKKIKTILVRSPIAGGPDHGLYATQLGVRTGRLLSPGTNVGLEASQAIGERVSQLSVGKKHLGATKKESKSLTSVLRQLISVPKNYSGAAHATIDGKVTKITEAPTGGFYVYVGDKPHYVAIDNEVLVKPGDTVEAGDVLSEGLPNPAAIVKYKGIGEGRRYFTKLLMDVLTELGIPAHRRNAEIVARGLIDLVEVTHPFGDNYPGDVLHYNFIEREYKPRKDSLWVNPKRGLGKYLERPVLQFTIGTRLTPSVIKQLEQFNIDKILVNTEPPPFQPIMIRAMDYLEHDPEFLPKLLGSYQKKKILEAAAYGGVTEKYKTTSFVPALAEGARFGKDWPQQILSK